MKHMHIFKWGNKWIIAIMIIGALKGFVTTSIFPFFNNVDEFQHFDVIIKYSHHFLIPPDKESYNEESIKYRVLFHSTEYSSEALIDEDLPGWKKGINFNTKKLVREQRLWKGVNNHESQQPPVYYALLGSLFFICKTVGLNGPTLIYVLRWTNIIFYCMLIFVSHKISLIAFKEKPVFFQYLLPIMIVGVPQSSFFMLGNDSLHPLFSSVALLYFMKNKLLFQTSFVKIGIFSLICLFTFFTKYSSLSILFIFPAFLILEHHNNASFFLKALFIFLLIILVPVVFWSTRNYMLFDNLTGNMAGSGNWTIKPVSQWALHPIFSIKGFYFFIFRTFTSFWRGEVIWYGKWIQSNILDMIFVLISIVFPLIGIVNHIKTGKQDKAFMYCLIICLSILFLVGCSLIFDFGNWFYPSRKKPYLVSGRLIMGMIVPFLILFIDGIYFCCGKRNLVAFIVIIIFVFIIQAWEAYLHWPVFLSPYNWFHL